ncbi:MAG TPA: amino acid permease [Anaerovoracaceae bacterium]|nr:amino acid permease [Anaerovoracaceae bacterium]
MEEKQVGQGKLKRNLKQRHLTMIAIGGSIGTALFLSTGYALNQAGPGGLVAAYLVVAVMIYFIIMSLGEMATYLPCAGSFQTYSSLYVGPSFGFSIGWCYWFSWAVVVGIEVVASALIMKYWFPDVPSWIWSIIFVVFVVGLNLMSAKAYGEAEFWFASIKVIAVVSFLAVGAGMMAGIGNPDGAIGFTNFVNSEGGLFPKGVGAFLVVSFTAVFCYLGTEIVGIAAGEGENPEKTIPKAVKTVFIRIAIFYIGSTFMVAALIPWQQGTVEVSPFTLAFSQIGIPGAATLMNFVVLTSTLSCANAGLYASSRMVFAMAKEGKAPKIFANVNKRGVPVPALILTGAMGGAAFLSKFISPDQVYVLLVSASAITVLFAWIGICISHINFRKNIVKSGRTLDDIKFKAPFYPYGSYIAAILCVVVIIAQFFDSTARLTAVLGVPMFFILWGIGKYKEKKGTLWVPSEESIRAQSITDAESQKASSAGGAQAAK